MPFFCVCVYHTLIFCCISWLYIELPPRDELRTALFTRKYFTSLSPLPTADFFFRYVHQNTSQSF